MNEISPSPPISRPRSAHFAGALALLGGVAATAPAVRQVVSLDGEWQFELLAGDNVTQRGTIQVPGAWEAQGYGTETVTYRSQVVTGQNTGAVGVYTKKLVLSPCKACEVKPFFAEGFPPSEGVWGDEPDAAVAFC